MSHILEKEGKHTLTVRLEQDGGATIRHDGIVAFAFSPEATASLKAFLNQTGRDE